jgi:uncharacterized integral membrane protein
MESLFAWTISIPMILVVLVLVVVHHCFGRVVVEVSVINLFHALD